VFEHLRKLLYLTAYKSHWHFTRTAYARNSYGVFYDFDYISLETKSIIAWQTIVGCRMPNNNEVRATVLPVS
jgi:uncharacterized membrane protein